MKPLKKTTKMAAPKKDYKFYENLAKEYAEHNRKLQEENNELKAKERILNEEIVFLEFKNCDIRNEISTLKKQNDELKAKYKELSKLSLETVVASIEKLNEAQLETEKLQIKLEKVPNWIKSWINID